jgi:hypothetical protein
VNEGVFRDEYQRRTLSDKLQPSIVNSPYVGFDARFGAYRIHTEGGYHWERQDGDIVQGDGHLDVDVQRAFEGGHSIEAHLINLERAEGSQDYLGQFQTKAWREGTIQLGYRLQRVFAVGGIFDYTTEPLTTGEDHTWYPAAAGEYDFTPSSNFKIFAGSSRGGLRCINGVCKTFAPFTGVKGTLTLRY